MNKYVLVGWGFLIAGSIILGLFLVLGVHSCLSNESFPFPVPFSMARCYIIIQSVYSEIIIGIPLVITGIVLRVQGHKKERKIS